MIQQADSEQGRVIQAISQNTEKYHRLKTDEEKAGELFCRHLDMISAEHAKIRERHKKSLHNGKELDSLLFKHLDFGKLEPACKDILTELASKKGQPAREYHSSVMTQLALGFMDRTPHFHHGGFCGEKAQALWMPAYQGVRFHCINRPSAYLLLGHYVLYRRLALVLLLYSLG